MARFSFFAVLILFLFRCSTKPAETGNLTDSIIGSYEETYRPLYHFSPPYNWMNDPNGLVYLDGEYHLYYQWNPYGDVWGHMSWGHAVSKDLLHWEHLPVAIYEYVDSNGDSTMVYSGSAVADINNTSGFFPEKSTGLVAIYTSDLHDGTNHFLEHQSIAYSADKGRTFTRYEKNPVLNIERKDFRDPKVIWYEPEQKWVMAVSIPDQFKIHFYESKNLKEWNFLSEFGPLGDTNKIWECPDLFPVVIEHEPGKKKWVLIVSNSHPQNEKFVGMQYFIGDFDGKKFTADNPTQYPLYLDYGKDYYAAVTYNNVPGERTVLFGWANNWAYGKDIPTSPWRSAMALPREIWLKKTEAGYRIYQKTIREAESLRVAEINISTSGTNAPRSVELECEFTPTDAKVFGLKLFKSDNEETVLAYDSEKQEVYLDRTRSGNTSFHPTFSSVERVPVQLENGKLKLHVYMDQSILEVFVQDGESVITEQVFPTHTGNRIEVFSEGGSVASKIKGWEIKSTWKK